jgi:hypothetical protein
MENQDINFLEMKVRNESLVEDVVDDGSFHPFTMNHKNPKFNKIEKDLLDSIQNQTTNTG